MLVVLGRAAAQHQPYSKEIPMPDRRRLGTAVSIPQEPPHPSPNSGLSQETDPLDSRAMPAFQTSLIIITSLSTFHIQSTRSIPKEVMMAPAKTVLWVDNESGRWTELRGTSAGGKLNLRETIVVVPEMATFFSPEGGPCGYIPQGVWRISRGE